MDDILKVLVIMAVSALPLIRQIRKSKTERSVQKPFVPILDTEEAEVLQTSRRHQTFHPQPLPLKAEMKKNKTIPPKMETSPTDDPEFTIRLAEEARKAVIWSEILNRKYWKIIPNTKIIL